MTGIDNRKTVSLPAGLRGQLATLERRLWKTETSIAVCAIIGTCLLSCLALFISDRFWDTPIWLRAGFAALSGIGLIIVGGRWLSQWVFKRRDQRALANLVQRRYRRLGDRLLGIVELADEERRPSHFSPELYQAAIDQVAAEAQPFDFALAVNTKSARRTALGLAGLLMIGLVLSFLSPPAAWNAFLRWIAPASRTERFSLVLIDDLPLERIVPHGEGFDVSFRVQYRSFWKPWQAVCQVGQQPRINAKLHGEEVTVHVPGQVQRGTLKVRLGDARREMTVVPVHRPSLQELSASTQLPEYLRYPTEKQRAEMGSLHVLEGSRVSFEGKISRALREAQVVAGDRDPQPLQVRADRFSSELLAVDDITELSFRWKDELGLDSAAPWRLQIRSQKDSPPTPELPELLKDTAVLESEVLEIKTIARDDYGVRELGLTWQIVGADSLATNSPASQRFQFPAPTPREKNLETRFHFSPAILMIPPDSIVELRAFATDYFPDRQASETPVYRLHILGNERHAELVRQNLESLLSRLEEVTRLEEKVTASTRELKDLPKDKLNAADTAERISTAKEEQNQNSTNLERLADEGKKTLREAFRNPTFNEETLREWTKTLQAMQQLSDEKMQQASKALESARQEPSERPENLAKALEKEEEILKALEQMQRQVNKGLDQLQALTLAQRLRKIASDENEIAGRLQRIVPETIGLLPKELPPKFRSAEASLAGDQDAAQKDAQVLHGEIGRFFERTQKEKYGEVNKAMNEAHVVDELDRVRGLIQENISMNAMQNLADWSGRLKSWADLLEPKSDGSNGGGGGEGSSGDDALMRELLGLLRVRDREFNLRQRTALLEKQKAEMQGYRESAQALASHQGQVREDMNKIQSENPVPALEFPLQDIIDEMEGVEGLLKKPQTDRETDAAQIKSIELVSDVINLINEQQQRSKNDQQQQSSSADEMAFLMQMMAQQTSQALGLNPKGGGNPNGGSTDRPATPWTGDPNSPPGESRTVSRASGGAANFPTEFRDALESYFRAVEKLDKK